MSVNIQKVIDLCKKQKRLLLLRDPSDGSQWISDGGAMYPLLGAPLLSEDSIRALYSLPDNVKVETDELPTIYNYTDTSRYEKPVFYEKIQLRPCGEAVITLRTGDGVAFIHEKYLKVLEAGENGEPMLFERIDDLGRTYIVAKQGLFLEAVIPPIRNLLKADWLDDLQNLVAVLRQTFEKEEKLL